MACCFPRSDSLAFYNIVNCLEQLLMLSIVAWSLKGSVSRDWGGLLMVQTDKAHFFNVAGAHFYRNSSTFL